MKFIILYHGKQARRGEHTPAVADELLELGVHRLQILHLPALPVWHPPPPTLQRLRIASH